MIDPCHKLLVVQQARLLDLSRSSVYCLPKLTPDADLLLMRRMDELHLEYPFAGARMLCDMLALEGFEVNRNQFSNGRGVKNQSRSSQYEVKSFDEFESVVRLRDLFVTRADTIVNS